jgi:DNA-binding response OmpR family regulator
VSSLRVLIVDDDEGVLDLFERAFVREEFTVRATSDSQHALALMLSDLPDLVVLDLMMPWVNGIQLLAAMRQQPSLVAVPALVVTATATSAFDLRDFGPLRVLRKPVALARLVKAARAMLAGTDADSQSED